MMTELLPYWREAPFLILQPVCCLVFTVLALHLAVGGGDQVMTAPVPSISSKNCPFAFGQKRLIGPVSFEIEAGERL